MPYDAAFRVDNPHDTAALKRADIRSDADGSACPKNVRGKTDNRYARVDCGTAGLKRKIKCRRIRKKRSALNCGGVLGIGKRPLPVTENKGLH